MAEIPNAISSINFKKSNAIQTMHNDRTLPPSYLIDSIGCECNRNNEEARAMRDSIVKSAREAYEKNKSPRAPKFKAKSYEWSAVVNIKPDTTMQDLENLAKYLHTNYGFTCYQIAIHRDEGHIDEQGKKRINHHAHLEFITLDIKTGKNNYRREFINQKTLRAIQTDVAKILGMERGVDKNKSGVKRIEPRIWARMKEQEKAAVKELKAKSRDLESQKQTLETKINQLENTLQGEKISKEAIKLVFDKVREASKNKGLSKEYFKELAGVKKYAIDNVKTSEELESTINSLVEKHAKKSILGGFKINYEALCKEFVVLAKEENKIAQTMKDGVIEIEDIDTYKALLKLESDEELREEIRENEKSFQRRVAEKEQEKQNFIDSLQDGAAYKKLQNENNKLQEKNKSLYNELDKQNTETAKLKNDHKDEIKGLNDKIQNLEDQNAEKNRQITSLYSEIDKLKARLKQLKEKLKERIRGIANKLNKLRDKTKNPSKTPQISPTINERVLGNTYIAPPPQNGLESQINAKNNQITKSAAHTQSYSTKYARPSAKQNDRSM